MSERRVADLAVALLASSSQIGGGNRSLLGLASGLQRRGVRVVVVSPGDGPLVQACMRGGGVCEVIAPFQPAWSSPLGSVRATAALVRCLRDHRCDIVHANDPTIARAAALAAWWCRRPLVCHVRFPVTEQEAAWSFRRLPPPAVLVFNSEALRRESGPLLGRACPGASQLVVHNGVDLTAYRPAERRSGSPPRVGIVANLIPVKGHIDFLEMGKLLRERHPDLVLRIIGDDIHGTGHGEAIRAKVAELGLDGAVELLGHRDDVPELLAELDVLVCASHVEPFGRCLIEAMAVARPVVATRVGGIPEVVDDGVTGLLVPPHEPARLADAVSELLADGERRGAMGRAGRRRAEELFGEEGHVERLLAIYADLRVTARRS